MNSGYVFFTGAACSLLLLACARLGISHARHAGGRYLLILLAGVFFYLLRPILPAHGSFVGLLLDFPTILIPAAFWLFAYQLCSECDQLPRWGWILITLHVLINIFANHLEPAGWPQLHQWLYVLAQPSKLLLLLAGGITLLQQFQSDLVEARRSMRAALLIATGGYMFIVVCAEILFSYYPVPAGLTLLHAVLASLLVLSACLWLLALAPNALQESLPTMIEPQHAEPVTQPSAPEPLDDGQRKLLEKLQAHMNSGGYRHTGLTIRELAELLDAREHILRNLINRHLGYRNFNEYLNQFRINEASARLADPNEAHLPVLSIALDIGYRSLSPFNAAFKRRHEQTPTEFRREQLPA